MIAGDGRPAGVGRGAPGHHQLPVARCQRGCSRPVRCAVVGERGYGLSIHYRPRACAVGVFGADSHFILCGELQAADRCAQVRIGVGLAIAVHPTDRARRKPVLNVVVDDSRVAGGVGSVPAYPEPLMQGSERMDRRRAGFASGIDKIG